MTTPIFKYFRLLHLLVRHGRLKHSGYDFTLQRMDSLQTMSRFVPPVKKSPAAWLFRYRPLVWKWSFLRTLLSETAFLKNNLFRQGGHLHSPFLNIAYIRIPKSASTSLASVILKATYEDYTSTTLTTTQINFLADVNLKTTLNTDADAIFFTAVRNPFARLASVYHDFFETTSGGFIYRDYLFGIFKKDTSFKTFVTRLSAIPDTLKDQHLKPQHLFLDYYRKRVNNIVLLKVDKPGEIQSFLSIYDLDLPVLNESTTPYDYRSYYDAETFKIAAAIYKKDIAQFRYEADVKRLEEFINNGSPQSTADGSR